MLRLGDEDAARLSPRLGGGPREGEPVAALLSQTVDAQPAQQYIVRASILGVQLEALALEPLGLHRAALGALKRPLLGDREAEDGQPAVLLPELADAAADAEAGLGEAARPRLGGGLAAVQQGEGRKQHEGDHDQTHGGTHG